MRSSMSKRSNKIRIVRNEEILEETNTDEGLVPGTITSQYTKPSSQYINLKRTLILDQLTMEI